VKLLVEGLPSPLFYLLCGQVSKASRVSDVKVPNEGRRRDALSSSLMSDMPTHVVKPPQFQH